MPSILVFDINETTLDIEYTAPVFERVFGNKAVLREWFAQLILYSNAISLAGPYATFFELGQGLLEMLADIHRVSVKPSDVEELRHRFATLPAHPDVEQGLTQLKAAGFRLVAFTNSPPVHPSPAENAGLGKFFEREFSIDRVGDLSRRLNAITWSLRSSTWSSPNAAWSRHTFGTRSAPNARATRAPP